MARAFLPLLLTIACSPHILPTRLRHYGVVADARELEGGGGGADDDDAVPPTFAIAGYLPDYRSYVDVNATALHLTDLMLFSLTPQAVLRYSSPSSSSAAAATATGVGGCCLSQVHYDLIRRARAHKEEQLPGSNVRLLLTVGGGGRSDGFGGVVSGDDGIRSQFVKNLVQIW